MSGYIWRLFNGRSPRPEFAEWATQKSGRRAWGDDDSNWYWRDIEAKRMRAQAVWNAFQAILAIGCYSQLTLALEQRRLELDGAYSHRADMAEREAMYAVQRAMELAGWVKPR